MNRKILIIVGVVVLAILGWFTYTMIQGSSTDRMMVENEGMMEEEKMEGDSMMENGDSSMTEEGSYGKVLAGTSSPFVEFTQAGYEKALGNGKIVFLDFYANWCPICRVEAPVIDAGFNGLTTDQVVGFRVSFNDPETDADEKALASEFNVPYQHTKVMLVDGKEVARSQEQWDKADFDKFFNQVLN